ncbi:MAG: VanZ family protein [Sulfurimonas sp.]|nr:VanZ family protein [Sulfurimonas sp.]MBU3938984.1 VanZ family protein [bacterium]MBU4025718.1 VanZ family protein [bacterium]MBU4060186.1 VanZ family protein [bacterium]MBU4109473.1 VanZ family protein [bacterium]
MQIKNLFQVMFYTALLCIMFLATTTIKIEAVESMWDKSNHFIAFFVLYVLLSLAYKELSAKVKITLLLAFAVFIEVVQYFIPGRFFSLMDVVADGIGIAIGIALYGFYRNKTTKVSS